MDYIPSTIKNILSSFRDLFTAPTFRNFQALMIGWVLCVNRHSISRVIQFSSTVHKQEKWHTAYYRFFSRANWRKDQLGNKLLDLCLQHVQEETLTFVVDDTLHQRSGPHIWGGGMHIDLSCSTYGRRTSASAKKRTDFGHNWVTLSLWMEKPWSGKGRGVAIPILCRLYRGKKHCPEEKYKKRTELAVEMIKELDEWLGEEVNFRVLGDYEYVSSTVAKELPEDTHLMGTIQSDAVMYKLGTGPRKGNIDEGQRLPKPETLLEQETLSVRTLQLYGKEVEIEYASQIGLWPTVFGDRLVKVFVIRDPEGRYESRCYVTTDIETSVKVFGEQFTRRWSQEVTYRETKQHLGLEDPQNGWWRGGEGETDPGNQPGPNPEEENRENQKAVKRTVPFVFYVYGMLIFWYLQHGDPEEDVEQVRKRAPWYRSKEEPSFADMLNRLRTRLWKKKMSQNPVIERVSENIEEIIPEWLIRA